ncbi:MAG: substrate-binding domain-containing protein [Anaerolineales bacterium]|nr:substrate-binding domain-containing protein [Anaerolineales bacterium]
MVDNTKTVDQIKRHTIGFISTWPIYQGTTIDWYARSLIQGISSAAWEMNCNLLLGCGFNVAGNFPRQRSFWPVSSPGVDFVPVGPWNTDGLIIVPDDLTSDQSQYIEDLLNSGFPIIFTTPEGPGSTVRVDNQLGIRMAYQHLREHGHTQIAFIAGHTGSGGDSEERLNSYQECVEEAGFQVNPQLIAFGNHRKSDGAKAMQQIINSKQPFSAVIASNDLSGIGAAQAIKQNGLNIPEDIAIIGFDDILESRTMSPPLTTVRHPTFSLGYQAVKTLYQEITKKTRAASKVVVAPHFVLRQSCGCKPVLTLSEDIFPSSSVENVIEKITQAIQMESRNSLFGVIKNLANEFLISFSNSVKSREGYEFIQTISRLLTWCEKHDEDAILWQSGLEYLTRYYQSLVNDLTPDSEHFIQELLEKARTLVSDEIQRQKSVALLGYMDSMSQLGQLTTEMLSVMDISEGTNILNRHIPQMGIKSILLILYHLDNDDPKAKSEILLSTGLETDVKGLIFDTRSFPAQKIYSSPDPLHLIILPLDVEEKNTGFVAFDAPNPELCAAIVHNLSAALRTSKLYQEAIEGRRQAEEANQMKSRFLSMVSHELRTPLSLIVGLSEMVLRLYNGEEQLVEPPLHDIEQINNSSQHLARLIGDVLDLASSEAGKLRINKEPVRFTDVLETVNKLGQEMAESKGLQWYSECCHQDIWVLGDRTRLRQILLNLISNAVKYTPTGKVQLSVESDNQDVRISISDTGLGVKPDEIKRIFEEFYRSERIKKSGYNGLGLGLAITRQLIDQHNGEIEVSSPGILGSGSTFSISIPRIPEPSFSDADSILSVSSRKSIIVLEENPESSEIIQKYLGKRRYQYRVLEFSKERNWFSEILETDPSTIILEENLAKTNGWYIKETLKSQDSTASIPVYALSIDANHGTGELLEMNYLNKPLNYEHLAKELSYYLSSPGKSQVVLVVDDDPGILEMNCRLIEQTDRQTIRARNGVEALKAIDHTRPDLILLDLMMPEMDGFALLDILRSQESTRDIPVIILTSHILSDFDLERYNKGVARILGKGIFSADEILNHIDIALEKQNKLGKATQQLVHKAMTFIHTHYADPLSRKQIAKHTGISSDYLTDCFRQELGITPVTYIRRYRIRQACEMLKNTDESITQIALNAGFSDGAHFSRTFVKEIGVTPRVYRRSGIGNTDNHG